MLSLYGQLAAAMTPGTFVAGEAASIAPLRGEYHRAMYLPPNGASNATFLETLRLLLVHETLDAVGSSAGSSWRTRRRAAWLAPGKRIAVRAVADELRPALVLDPVDPERRSTRRSTCRREAPRALGCGSACRAVRASRASCSTAGRSRLRPAHGDDRIARASGTNRARRHGRPRLAASRRTNGVSGPWSLR